jgi:hypothetical protein
MTVNSATQAAGLRCQLEQGNVLAAFTLRNSHVKPTQILFYQLSLFRFKSSAQPIGWWAPGVVRGNGKSKRFGMRDSLSSFDVKSVAIGQPLLLQIDVLPRLFAIIKSGEHGIDSALEHWQLRGAYFGQAIWGKTRLETTWRSIEVKASFDEGDSP